MDLTQIRYFLALAKALNFTRAAELCHVTQPALTKSIQRLEEELGGSLLLRERSRTQLTPLGETMLPLLQQTYDAAEAARASARQFRAKGVQHLRVGLGAWVEPAMLTPLLAQVMRHVPDVEVTIRHGEADALNTWLLASDVDVALMADAARLSERTNRWPVFADPIVVLAARGHTLAQASSVSADALREHAIVGRLAGGEMPLEGRYPALPPLRHHGSTEEHVQTLVRLGAGIALSTARRALPNGIVRLALEPRHTLDVVVAAVAGRALPRAADAFLRLARARHWDFDALD